jgi:ABC-2 family transporter protein
MRWHILKTLLHKEALRHATNRGGLTLAGLLVTVSLVLAALNPAGDKGAQLVGGIHHFLIDTDDEASPWIQHLRHHVPADLNKHVHFRKIDPKMTADKEIFYPPGSGAIQIRKDPESSTAQPHYVVTLRHPTGDRAGMAVYEQWFWRETYRFFHQQAADELKSKGIDPATTLPAAKIDADELWEERLWYEQLRTRFSVAAGTGSEQIPTVTFKETPLAGPSLDMRAAMATALVMFALFFTCVYLMPSLTCEERERGLLLAQALSPARVRELLAAKFLFYPAFGILLAMILAGIHNTAVLTRPFFWLSIISLGMGALGIGMTIASLAKTQRAASLAALCYMLVVALFLLICQQNNISYLPYLAVEYHAPQVLHATLTNQTRPYHWYNLVACAGLAVVWVCLAGYLFRKRGWQ